MKDPKKGALVMSLKSLPWSSLLLVLLETGPLPHPQAAAVYVCVRGRGRASPFIVSLGEDIDKAVTNH